MDPLSPDILATLERLASGGFELLPMAEVSTHYIVARDGFVAMVERRPNGAFGTSGNPGKLTDHGLALFLRRGEQDLFVAKGWQSEATLAEAAQVRQFAADLKAALAR